MSQVMVPSVSSNISNVSATDKATDKASAVAAKMGQQSAPTVTAAKLIKPKQRMQTRLNAPHPDPITPPGVGNKMPLALNSNKYLTAESGAKLFELYDVPNYGYCVSELDISYMFAGKNLMPYKSGPHHLVKLGHMFQVQAGSDIHWVFTVPGLKYVSGKIIASSELAEARDYLRDVLVPELETLNVGLIRAAAPAVYPAISTGPVAPVATKTVASANVAESSTDKGKSVSAVRMLTSAVRSLMNQCRIQAASQETMFAYLMCISGEKVEPATGWFPTTILEKIHNIVDLEIAHQVTISNKPNNFGEYKEEFFNKVYTALKTGYGFDAWKELEANPTEADNKLRLIVKRGFGAQLHNICMTLAKSPTVVRLRDISARIANIEEEKLALAKTQPSEEVITVTV